MLGLFESLVAISVIAMTCQVAGRIPAMMMTAFAAASAAIIMPPFASWAIQDPADLLAVVLQTLVGLTVVYSWPRKNQLREQPAPSFSDRSRNPGYSLNAIVQSVMKRNRELAAKINHIQICADLHGSAAVSRDDLERIISDVMEMAFSQPNTRHARIYTACRPNLDEIRLITEFDDALPQPRVRILSRSDHHCPIQTKAWPANCSATFFDNGSEQTYQISIRKAF